MDKGKAPMDMSITSPSQQTWRPKKVLNVQHDLGRGELNQASTSTIHTPACQKASLSIQASNHSSAPNILSEKLLQKEIAIPIYHEEFPIQVRSYASTLPPLQLDENTPQVLTCVSSRRPLQIDTWTGWLHQAYTKVGKSKT